MFGLVCTHNTCHCVFSISVGYQYDRQKNQSLANTMPSKSLPNTEGRALNLNSSNPSSSNLDGELFGILRDREERVTFLERELVETRLQLAIAKTSEDNLLHEAKKLRFHLKKGGRSEVQEDQDNDASATDFQRTLSLPHNVIQIRPSLYANSSERRTPEDRANGVCMPMGQPIRSRDPTSSSGDQSESTDPPPPRLNLNSCASGLDLLAGNMNAVSHLNSSICSIHRMLGDLGRSTAPNDLRQTEVEMQLLVNARCQT